MVSADKDWIWQFYAVTVCLYLVLGFPGFVHRYLRRRAA
jgi:hypothetical protein